MSHWLLSTIGHLGYAGIGILMLLENIILPLPSELTMPLGGFVASRGRLGLAGVLAAGFAGPGAGVVRAAAEGPALSGVMPALGR